MDYVCKAPSLSQPTHQMEDLTNKKITNSVVS
jgi:hypothetical protein